MDGKYVGNRPIKLSKIKDDLYGKIDTVSVSGRKVCVFPSSFHIHLPSPPSPTPISLSLFPSHATLRFSPSRIRICKAVELPRDRIRANEQAKELDKLRKNRGKPLDGRPVPF